MIFGATVSFAVAFSFGSTLVSFSVDASVVEAEVSFAAQDVFCVQQTAFFSDRVFVAGCSVFLAMQDAAGRFFGHSAEIKLERQMKQRYKIVCFFIIFFIILGAPGITLKLYVHVLLEVFTNIECIICSVVVEQFCKVDQGLVFACS